MALLDSPKNYNELLPKLNKATFLITLLFFIALRVFNTIPYIKLDDALIPQLKDHKELIEWLVSFGAIPFAAACAAFILSHVFEMHNKVAKILKIRFLWDKYFIATPLAKRAGVQVPLTPSNVKRIMNGLYYPKVRDIDQHYVQLFWRYALPFWILFEHALIVLLTALVLSFVMREISILWVWAYFFVVAFVTTLQLLFVTAPKSTDQADQLLDADVSTFFNQMT